MRCVLGCYTTASIRSQSTSKWGLITVHSELAVQPDINVAAKVPASRCLFVVEKLSWLPTEWVGIEVDWSSVGRDASNQDRWEKRRLLQASTRYEIKVQEGRWRDWVGCLRTSETWKTGRLAAEHNNSDDERNGKWGEDMTA